MAAIYETGRQTRTRTQAPNELAIRLRYRNRDYGTLVELRGSKDDIIEVMLTGLFIFAVGAIITALLRG